MEKKNLAQQMKKKKNALIGKKKDTCHLPLVLKKASSFHSKQRQYAKS